VIIEGSYRMAEERIAEHSSQVKELEQKRDAIGTELEEMRRRLENAPPFELRYYTGTPPGSDGYLTSYFVAVKNSPGQPERRARMSAEGMDPYPQSPYPYSGVRPEFPHDVPSASGSPAAAGLVIGPGQEESWFLGRVMTGTDGKITVFKFFSDLDGGWELLPGERWRITYRIACPGVPEVEFSVVMTVEDGKFAFRFED
jgi:hypothetical protein